MQIREIRVDSWKWVERLAYDLGQIAPKKECTRAHTGYFGVKFKGGAALRMRLMENSSDESAT